MRRGAEARTGRPVAVFQPVVAGYRTAWLNRLDELLEGGAVVFSVAPRGSSWQLDGTGGLKPPLRRSRTLRLGPLWFVPRALVEAFSPRWSALVLSWNVRQIELLPVLAVARLRGLPVVLWGHGVGSSRSRLVRRLRRLEAELASAVLAYSERGAAAVRDLAPHARVAVARNTTGRPPPEDSQRLTEVTHRVAFLGRLDERKRVDHLVEAIAILRSQGVALSLDVIGDGPERRVLEQRCADRGLADQVHFLGPVGEWPELSGLLAKADLVVIPRHAGLAVVDAMAAGRGVVVEDDPQAHPPEADEVVDGVTGLRYSPGAPQGLAGCLTDAYRDPDLIRGLSEAAIEHYRQELILERSIASFAGAVQPVPTGGGGAHEKPAVLVWVASFPPDFEATGPARSVAAAVSRLGDQFCFHVVTRASPAASDEPEEGWADWSGARVMRLSGRRSELWRAARELRGSRYDVLYLNSFFNRRFTWFPLLLWLSRWTRADRVILAPRGELSRGALGFKSTRKRAAVAAFRRLGLHRRVEWHVSSSHEADDLRSVMGRRTGRVHVALNLTERTAVAAGSTGPAKRPGSPIRVVFLSRIAPKKNLAGVLHSVRRCQEAVELVIAGPVADARYWEACRGLIEDLPEHLAVHYVGSISRGELLPFLAGFDLLFLPTYGENFAHVIAESLQAGTPVLISDQTPWSDVAVDGAGFVCPADDHDAFASLIDRYARLPAGEALAHRAAAREFAARRILAGSVEDHHRSMFAGEVSG